MNMPDTYKHGFAMLPSKGTFEVNAKSTQTLLSALLTRPTDYRFWRGYHDRLVQIATAEQVRGGAFWIAVYKGLLWWHFRLLDVVGFVMKVYHSAAIVVCNIILKLIGKE